LKKILVYLVTFIVGLAAGAAGIVFLEPSLLSHTPPPIVEAVPFNPKTAVSVTESDIQSNLAGIGHYVSFDLEFQVMPQALTAAGGSVAGAAGGSGTGSPVLDAKIRNQLIALARSTTYGELTSSGGLTVFKDEVSEILQSIFGPDTVGNIYFSDLLTQ
jgi:flagellar basal body-associated protein FliL